jgi:N-acetylneuraminic acid mutarotase
MSKSIFLLFVILMLEQTTFGQDYWLSKDTVNGQPKSAATAFVIENRAYLVAGTDDFEYKRKMYSYRADQNDWDDEVSLGGDGGDGLARVGATSFALTQGGQTKGYVALGQTQTIAFMNDLWEYDRTTEAWTQKANFTGAPRKEAVSFVIANKAYVGTGNSASGLLADFFTYDPNTNSWAQISDFAGTARRAAVGFSMESYGFVGTGDDGTLRNDFWMYQPQTDQWIQKANFPGNARSGACGWAAFPVCYLGTGEDAAHTFHNDLWEYNYFLNNWTQRANLPGPGRKNAVAFFLDGWGHIATGYNDGIFYDDLWAYSGTASIAPNKMPAIEVYPNPTTDFVEFEMQEPGTTVQVYSAIGQEMKFATWQQGSKVKIDSRSFTPGTYFLVVQNNQMQYCTTFVKCNGY